ncbi:hypothetical protein AVEN_117882-1 [Araneus ventricosus]|uniref:Uncharacterized protein n=1 Tax=Araneus ventricosus TaxID=182803 RepID=A0A4Y2PRG2_ARAVE|nr:hypothetical protein AVEN_117882-1 [Araneus ventricosus]
MYGHLGYLAIHEMLEAKRATTTSPGKTPCLLSREEDKADEDMVILHTSYGRDWALVDDDYPDSNFSLQQSLCKLATNLT